MRTLFFVPPLSLNIFHWGNEKVLFIKKDTFNLWNFRTENKYWLIDDPRKKSFLRLQGVICKFYFIFYSWRCIWAFHKSYLTYMYYSFHPANFLSTPYFMNSLSTCRASLKLKVLKYLFFIFGCSNIVWKRLSSDCLYTSVILLSSHLTYTYDIRHQFKKYIKYTFTK